MKSSCFGLGMGKGAKITDWSLRSLRRSYLASFWMVWQIGIFIWCCFSFIHILSWEPFDMFLGWSSISIILVGHSSFLQVWCWIHFFKLLFHVFKELETIVGWGSMREYLFFSLPTWIFSVCSVEFYFLTYPIWCLIRYATEILFIVIELSFVISFVNINRLYLFDDLQHPLPHSSLQLIKPS